MCYNFCKTFILVFGLVSGHSVFVLHFYCICIFICACISIYICISFVERQFHLFGWRETVISMIVFVRSIVFFLYSYLYLKKYFKFVQLDCFVEERLWSVWLVQWHWCQIWKQTPIDEMGSYWTPTDSFAFRLDWILWNLVSHPDQAQTLWNNYNARSETDKMVSQWMKRQPDIQVAF